MVDWIPGISQIKSTFQLICGDVEGAVNTQENFFRQCPVVSQATSAAQLLTGDKEGALETQKQCFGTMSRVIESMPIAGHVKGLVHYAVGDNKGGNRAMKSSTRTFAVMGAGAAGFAVGGPLGAVLAGITAGPTTDIVYTGATGKSHGIVAALEGLGKNPTAGGYFDTVCIPIGDAMAGMSGGNMVKSIHTRTQLQNAAQYETKANTALDFAENARDAMQLPEADILNAYNLAKQYKSMAESIRSRVNGVSQGTDLSGKFSWETASVAQNSFSVTSAPINLSRYDEDLIRNIHTQRGRLAVRAIVNYVSRIKTDFDERQSSSERHGRGEHVINNGVIKVYRNIIEDFLWRFRLTIEDIRRTERYGKSSITRAYDDPLPEQVKHDIANVMIAHIPSDVFYVDRNARVFGRLIQILHESAVHHMVELCEQETLTHNYGTQHTAKIRAAIQQINSNKVYVDETALQYWLRTGGNPIMYERSREAVEFMFENLYGNLHEWASQLRRRH